jgi:hypothetical protein
VTLPYDFEDSSEEQDQTAEYGSKMSPVPVRIMFDENQQVSPQFCSWMTFPIGQTGVSPATQICTHRYHRYKAKFIVNFPGAGTLYIARVPDYLNTGATGNAFALTVAAAITGNLLPDYDGEQPVYAIASIAGVSISVMDESYGTVQ